MLAQEWRERAPAVLLVAASAILTAAFILPVGQERRMGTSYARLEGWVSSFAKPDPAVPAGSTPTAAPGAAAAHAAGGPAAAGWTPSSATRSEPAAETARPFTARSRPAAAGKAALSRARSRAKSPEVSQSSATVAASAAIATIAPPPAAAAAPVETADSVADEYEGNPAKYPLDADDFGDAVALKLRGVSRSGGRFILKVAVSNRGREDFFIKDLAIRDGQEILDSRFFMRLFVEPGRTREGYVVFSKPRNGARIHVALKEDRENGRSLDVAVRYPF